MYTSSNDNSLSNVFVELKRWVYEKGSVWVEKQFLVWAYFSCSILDTGEEAFLCIGNGHVLSEAKTRQFVRYLELNYEA